MRMGRKPTLKQKMLIKSRRLNPKNWLVLQDDSDKLVVLHRWGVKPREIKKKGRDGVK